MRSLWTHGRLLTAFALVLLVLAGTRLIEFQAINSEKDGGVLIAIETATVREASEPTRSFDVQLPVRKHRDRREVVQLLAVSAFELEHLPAGDTPWELYVESFHDGGRLKVNGTVVAELPVTDAEITVRQLSPLRLNVPPGVLRVGRNVIEREWALHENLLLMPRMAIGEAKSIHALFATRDFAYRVLPGVTFVAALVLAFIMFSIYLSNRELKAYLWVTLSGLGFCGVDLMFLVHSVPSYLFPFCQLAVYVSGSAFILGTYYFLLEVSGVDAARYRRWTLSLCALFCAAFFGYHFWTGNTSAPVFTHTLLLLLACFTPLPLLALLRSLFRQFQWRMAVLLLIVLAAFWINVVDMTTMNAGNSTAQNGYLLQMFVLVWFLSICTFLITDFSRSLAAQRAQTATMARELAVQRAELSRLHTMERKAQEVQAAAQERRRIMQDMHDGLGSQLVSSLVMARAGELDSTQTCELLRSCIDDLRLAIDTSHDLEGSLLLALGNLRFRMQPRLKAAGITLHWETHTQHSRPLQLRAQDQLPVLRIVQESLTNALKHARAKRIAVEVNHAETGLVIRIEDDGQGFDVDAAKGCATGKGLNSLDKRARVLGAQLQIDSSEHGSVVWLRLPLPG